MIPSFVCNVYSAAPHRSVMAALVSIGLVTLVPSSAIGQMRVVTTTPNLADIVKQVGGDLVAVQSIMRGPEDVHNVAAKPSHMVKLKKADLFVHSGLDAELWAPLIVKGARNSRLLPGQPGNVDASRGVGLKEVPTRGGITRALGDIHAFGNVHFAQDPLNGVVIARNVAEALKNADPSNAELYDSRYASYADRLRALTEELMQQLSPYRGTPVVTYHRAWPYLLDRFGLRSVGEVEPKPGISPGPQHLKDCIQRMKSQGARIVIVETYSNREKAEFVASRAGGKAVVLALETGALPGADSYEELFRQNVKRLVEALKDVGGVNEAIGK